MNTLETLKCIFENSDTLVAVTDGDFRVLWKNSDKIMPFIRLEDFRVGLNDAPLVLPVAHEDIFRYSGGMAVKVTPVTLSEEMSGYMLTFFTEEEVETLYCRSGELRIRENFLGNIRRELGEIIYAADDITVKNPMDALAFRLDGMIQRGALRAFSATVNYSEMSSYYIDKIPVEFINLSRRTSEMLDWATVEFKNNGCKVNTDIQRGIFTEVSFDCLETAVLNLMVNGFMYNDAAEKKISVKLSFDGENITISVTDNGTSADIQRIRTLSQYGRQGENYRYGEVMGLTTVTKFAEYFDGTAVFENTATGGLRAEITFPHRCTKVPNNLCRPDLPYLAAKYEKQYAILSKGLKRLKENQ